ncbi:GT2 family glycosyltransferase [Paenibacillus phyllosphaerae]|uniref:GT2 family glycosyltransferase n=1 Tax=Paenibacillus phyllosphaerae TaxID=274593 RepID=A0A7W5FQN1_9BACL|nr:glycosyltransferase family 2 protein [Paenibacillus phyllosphaerae]MBB3113636.1 GT2 family glycosyltransferase [Paenibacillus phyllosphaerae]
MRRTSIIIPTFNGLAMLEQAVDAIRRYTNVQETPYELIVVDNASTDGTGSWCVQQGIRLIALPANTGFPAACNRGLRLASGDNLLLLNNDVTVSGGWLSGMLEALQGIEGAGMVGPVSNYVSGRQKADHPFTSLADFHRAAAEVYAQQLEPQPIMRLVGFCMLFKRELYDRIGELDERFSPGHYEDDDYCLRARMHGFSLYMCPRVFVHHEGSASFKRDNPQAVTQLVERNRRLFQEKWQVDPAQFM